MMGQAVASTVLPGCPTSPSRLSPRSATALITGLLYVGVTHRDANDIHSMPQITYTSQLYRQLLYSRSRHGLLLETGEMFRS